MLTKSDLSQIRNVFQEEIAPLKKDVGSLRAGVDSLEKDVKKINKKLDKTIDFFDNEHLGLKKRVVRIETHLSLSHPI